MTVTTATDPVLIGSDRDFQAEMNALIVTITEGKTYAVPDLARELYGRLLAEDPVLLNGWLHQNALAVLSKAIGDHVRSMRAAARAGSTGRKSSAGRFAAAARLAQQGDTSALALYATMHVVNPSQERKRAADMNGNDHRYVAQQYSRNAQELGLLGLFHETVAAKVGDHRTEDVLTAEQYEALYRSFVRPIGDDEL